ncbi:hypothetical protein [Flavobacterium sp.]|jgi:hypothetical protein|uniref:hypothetical protein n=1 Tax=Flavobacterium sp. TaxID=239 RepID=UPI0037C01D6A
MKKILIITIFSICNLIVYGQKEKQNEISLTVIGEGKTKEDAKMNGLRNAIEGAFGTFISSNTSVLNDELMKDEISSISSGNIKKYDIISETQMPNGYYNSVIKAIVSLNKLNTFCKNKGIEVEFNGNLFNSNVKIRELNKKNEEHVIENLCEIISNASNKIFDFSIDVSEPIKYNKTSGRDPDDLWIVPMLVTCKANKNILNVEKLLYKTIQEISLTEDEASDIKKQGLDVKAIMLGKESNAYYLRSEHSFTLLQNLFTKIIPVKSLNFQISNGIRNYSALEILSSLKTKTTYSQRNDFNTTNKFQSNPNNDNFMDINYPIFNIIPIGNLEFSSGVYKSHLEQEQRSLLYSIQSSIKNITNKDISMLPSSIDDSHESEYAKHILIIDFKDALKTEYKFGLNNRLTIEQLGKITKYKIEPVNQKKNE